MIDAVDVPGKADTLVWNSDTGKLEVDAAKKAAYEGVDRRGSLEKLVDELIGQGVIPPGKKNVILGS